VWSLGTNAPSRVYANTAFGGQVQVIRARPPKQSLASFFQNYSTTVLATVFLGDSVSIDVTVELAYPYAGGSAGTTTASGFTANAIYYIALDGPGGYIQPTGLATA
jgi:hypothetical protein